MPAGRRAPSSPAALPRLLSTGRSLALALLLAPPAAAQVISDWDVAPPLPRPLANNATASAVIDDTCFIFSFMGIDTTKIWSGITRLEIGSPLVSVLEAGEAVRTARIVMLK